MVDSNIIISAALFPESAVSRVLFHIVKNHKLVLCQHKNYPQIRDKYDIPVLVNTIEVKANILITGDKNFEGIEIENLKIVKPVKYIQEYMN